MVYQREGLHLSYDKVAQNLGVDRSTVCRTVDLFYRTGNITKKAYDSSNLPRKLTDLVKLILIQLILERPGIYIRELQAEIKEITGSDISAGSICNFFHAQGFSRQKMQLVAKQRCNSLRLAYATEVSIYNVDMFVFVDETGADRRDALRKYAYSWRGSPAKSCKLLVRVEHITALALMSCSGILDCKIVRGSVNGEVFYNFVQSNILPHLMPFNGTNPHSVVVLDNATIHHIDGIKGMIEEVGALVLFLPPYSPDYNPIEEAFGKVKAITKAYEQELEFGEMDIEDIVLPSFSHITPEDCVSWIADSEIYPM